LAQTVAICRQTVHLPVAGYQPLARHALPSPFHQTRQRVIADGGDESKFNGWVAAVAGRPL
jgi:hypothetical protein